ncbi:MAG TPA: DNA alkylation repair protein [Candidatus Bathyarchaeia archaeon]|nr:DNA alkylation repair protein [Candidatus Bathyarchaeia archaeon]
MTLTLNKVLEELRRVSNHEWAARSIQAGLRPENTWGVSVPNIRKIAKSIGRDHSLAQEVWDSKIHEAMILACMIDVPDLVSDKQMEEWVRNFDSWDVCDACCGSLFNKSKYAFAKAVEWSSREEEFVKRAGFALMASLAVHDKVASDAKFAKFLPIIARESTDSRHFVTKAANWALRQIGKRNLRLNRAATLTARRLSRMENRNSRWAGSDAYRELTGRPVQARLKGKHER